MSAGRYGSLRTLRKRSEFLRVQSSSLRCKGRHLVLLARAFTNSECRVGFTVSKKVGGAVVRNRVRRRLKEFLRQGLARLPGGFEFVIIAYSSAASASSDALLHDLQSIIGRFTRSHQRR